MNISNETKVGIFVVVSLIILIIGFNYLKGKEIFRHSDTYYAVYEKVDGISESNPVLMNGYKVGRIDNLEFIQGEKTKIIITISINDGLKIPSNTKARIVSTDITGTKALQLIFGDSKVYLQENDTMQGETEISLNEAVDRIVGPIDKKLNNIMARLQEVLNEEGVENLKKTFSNLRTLTENLNTLTASVNNSLANDRLGSILDNVSNITKTLEDNKDELNNVLSNLSNFSDSLKAAPIAQTIRKVNSVAGEIDQIAAKINKGEGSLGLLVNNDSLYRNLEATSENLNKLVIDLKQNPKRYVNISVFGGGRKDK